MTDTTPNHPTDEELRALSVGQFAEAELAGISAHLADCPACCRRIDELADDDHLVTRLQQNVAVRDEVLVGPNQRRSAVRALRQGHGAGVAREQDGKVASVVPPVPRQIGDYDILAEVGRGGMGVVYRAEHRSLHRPAALKMVLAGEFASPAQDLRFRLEAELAARVRHPNIVQVYEVGRHEGRPFLAMEWVEGGSLADRLDGTPWPAGEAAALVETLARAIHAAHAEGVVHRDLKPANILLTADGGRVTGGSSSPPAASPKITDFGLAQPTEGGQTLTRSGFLVGTPGYMAPEQAAGRRALVGPPTDVYALGVVLYQLLTGRLPFQADSTLEVLRAVASDEPTRPRRLQPHVPRDLEAITLHCLEKEPARRFPTALALAEDLGRFRAGRAVAARPVGATARLIRTCRRYPLVALLAVLLTTSLLVGLGGVTWKWLEADEQRDHANVYARQAEAEKQESLYEAYRARIAAAAAAFQCHDVADAARHLVAAPPALRGWEWRHLHSRLDESTSTILLPRGGGGFLLPGPDGIRVGTVTGDGLRLTDPDSGAPQVVPLDPEKVVRSIPHGPHSVRSVFAAQTLRGLRVGAWVGNSTFDLLDESGRTLSRVMRPGFKAPGLVVVSPDGTRLASPLPVVGGWNRVAMIDTSTGAQTAICDGHRDLVWALAFSPDGTRLASAGEDRVVRLWDPATGALLVTCRGHASKVLNVAFSPDGTRLLTTSSDGTVRQWETATGREVEAAYDRHTGEVFTAVYSPDGQWVASAGTDRTVRVWRATGRQDVAVLHGHTGCVVAVAFAPDGRRLTSLSRDFFAVGDDTVRVWDVDPRANLPVLRGHTRAVYPIAISPDGRWIASGSWDETVVLWDAATGQPCATLKHPGVVWDLAFAPDGSWLVSGCNADEKLRVWDVSTARVRKEIPLPTGTTPRSVTVSPDGRRVTATVVDSKSDKLRLHVFEVGSGERLFSAEGRALAYSHDGRWLAAEAANAKTVLLLDARSHETVARFDGHEKTVHKVAFSHDGRRLATCSKDHTVRIWEIDGGAYRVLDGHTDEVFAVAFHPDGTRLATGSRDGVIWLWDLARGEDVARLTGHVSLVWSLAFSPDGKTLVSGSGDTTVRLWDTSPVKARYQARHRIDAARPAAARFVD